MNGLTLADFDNLDTDRVKGFIKLWEENNPKKK
jgi:hypothetical protein